MAAPPYFYGKGYFDEYASRATTSIGHALNQARIEMVARHWEGRVVDVGIGSGQFVESRPDTYGYDVNEAGVAWLRSRDRFIDPYAAPVDTVTLWDALEHIADPAPLLENVKNWCFVSIPIFRDAAHVFVSRHFKKGEHLWYFARDGLIFFMERHGFECVEVNDEETKIGRDGILSFSFRRSSVAA